MRDWLQRELPARRQEDALKYGLIGTSGTTLRNPQLSAPLYPKDDPNWTTYSSVTVTTAKTNLEGA